MNTSSSQRPRARLLCQIARLGVAASVALALGVWLPVPALAETRGTDLVCGESIAQREIDQANRPDIQAPHAVVMGQDGVCYYERDADAQVKIASITKVMTALVALEHTRLSDIVTIDRVAATVGEASAHLREGDTLTLEDALRCLLIPSGNDAALAIATSVGALIDPANSDPCGVFVGAMNAKAAELGCTGTRFTNPHGLDSGAWAGDMHSTARDVAIMVAAAMKNAAFRAIVGAGSARVSVTSADGGTRALDLVDVNLMLNTEGNIGVKTGTTDEAGDCFAGAFSRDGIEMYTVVLGSDSADQRFIDSSTLANWHYAHMRKTAAVTSDERTAAGEPLIARAPHTNWSDKTVDVIAADGIPDVAVFDLADPAEQRISLTTFRGAVRRGEEAGTLTVSQAGKTIATIRLIAAQDCAPPNFPEWLLVQLDRFVRMLEGRPATSEASVFASAARL